MVVLLGLQVDPRGGVAVHVQEVNLGGDPEQLAEDQGPRCLPAKGVVEGEVQARFGVESLVLGAGCHWQSTGVGRGLPGGKRIPAVLPDDFDGALPALVAAVLVRDRGAARHPVIVHHTTLPRLQLIEAWVLLPGPLPNPAQVSCPGACVRKEVCRGVDPGGGVTVQRRGVGLPECRVLLAAADQVFQPPHLKRDLHVRFSSDERHPASPPRVGLK